MAVGAEEEAEGGGGTRERAQSEPKLPHLSLNPMFILHS